MEKVTIKSIVHNGKYANIELTDNRKISGNSEKEPKMLELKALQDVELDIKEWTNPQGVKMLFCNFPKPQGTGNPFKVQPKDEGLIIAQSSLNYSTQFYQQRQGTTQDVFKLAEEMVAFVKKHSTKTA